MLCALSYNLKNDLKIPTYLYYLLPSENPIPEEYLEYSPEIADTIEDKEENIIITPELIDFLLFTNEFKKIRKVIYWLSLDFFYKSMFSKTIKGRAISKINIIINKINLSTSKKFNKSFLPNFDIPKQSLKEYKKLDLSRFKPLSDMSLHLTQSVRIFDYLNKKGLKNVFNISDYNKKFLEQDYRKLNKEDIICFNPKKGFEFTLKIINHANSKNEKIKFIPITGLSRNEVINLLKRLKVYIDFGNFPGKDRAFREALMLGCCVITVKRGTAMYFENVPIPEEYKFEDKDKNIPKILEKIKECIKNYHNINQDFDEARNIIKQEPQKFVENLKKVFKFVD